MYVNDFSGLRKRALSNASERGIRYLRTTRPIATAIMEEDHVEVESGARRM